MNGTWHRYDRMRGAGWTMAHFDATDAKGYYQGPLCGYDPQRGLKRPAPVRVSAVWDGYPRCSRCERRLEKAA